MTPQENVERGDAPSEREISQYLIEQYVKLRAVFDSDPLTMSISQLATFVLMARDAAAALKEASDADPKFEFATDAQAAEGYLGAKLADLFEERYQTSNNLRRDEPLPEIFPNVDTIWALKHAANYRARRVLTVSMTRRGKKKASR